jgi:hypothetical protein
MNQLVIVPVSLGVIGLIWLASMIATCAVLLRDAP